MIPEEALRELLCRQQWTLVCVLVDGVKVWAKATCPDPVAPLVYSDPDTGETLTGATLCPPDDTTTVAVDVEYVCNPATGLFDQIVTTTIDGVAGEPVITPTELVCDTDEFDYEQPRVCRDGLWYVLLNQIAEDGTVVELAATSTGQPCGQDCKPDECVESQEWTFGLDNTRSKAEWSGIVCMSLDDGTTVTFPQTSHAPGDFSAQINEWQAGLQAAADARGLRWLVEVRVRKPSNPTDLSGLFGFPGPPSELVSLGLTSMIWRYLNIQICPGEPLPTGAVFKNDDKTTLNLVTDGPVLGPIQTFWRCKCCGEAPTWYLADGETPAEPGQVPFCPMPCGVIPLIDKPTVAQSCTATTVEACYAQGDDDPEGNDPPVAVVENLLATFIWCDGVLDGVTVTDLDGNEVPRPEDTYLADCDDLEPLNPEPPIPDCPKGMTFLGKYQSPAPKIILQDNSNPRADSNWPTVHLPKNADMVIGLFCKGELVYQSAPLAEPYYNEYANDPGIGCDVVYVCANHPKGCNASQAANLAALLPGFSPVKDEVFASAWALVCSACGPCIDEMRILSVNAATDQAWVGASKALITREGVKPPPFFAYSDGCGGIYYTDCEGAPINGPADGLCCAERCDTAAPVVDEGCEQCYIKPESEVTVEGSEADTWIIIPGVFELVRNPGGGGNPGFTNNATGGLEYSLDGTNFGAFGSQVFGDDLQNPNGATLFIRNTATGDVVETFITSWAGQGSNAFTGTATVTFPEESFTCKLVDGEPVCCNALGEPVDFDPEWELVECPTTLGWLESQPPVKTDERCYQRTVTLVDTDSVIDDPAGAAPVTSEPVVVTPSEPGEVCKIAIRVDNTNGEGDADPQWAPGVPIAIEINGTVYEFAPYESSRIDAAQTSPQPSLPGNIPRGRYDLCFYTPGLTVAAGVPLVINYFNDGGPGFGDPNALFWTANTDSDNGQVGALATGQYPQVTLYGCETECWSECDFWQNGETTTITYGPNGAPTDDPIPADAERVRCDCCTDCDKSTAPADSGLCYCGSALVGQRGLLHPASVFTYGPHTGIGYDAFATVIGAYDYTITDGPIYNEEGQEIADRRRLEICGPEQYDLTITNTVVPILSIGAVDLDFIRKPCPTAPDPIQAAILAKIEEMCEALTGKPCPALDIGTPTFTTDQSAVVFPVEACDPPRDFAVPFSIEAADCLTENPDALIRVRWTFDHEPEASTSHTGFNVSANDGATTWTPVAKSNTIAVDVGPAVPHTGPRDTYWADFDLPVSALLAGVAFQTSAFGTTSGECETIFSQTITISPDDTQLAELCDCC